MHSIGIGVDADTGQPQHGLGYLRNRGVAYTLGENHVVALRADGSARSGKRVEGFGDDFGRFVIRKVVRQQKSSGSRHKKRGDEDTRSSHVEIVYDLSLASGQ